MNNVTVLEERIREHFRKRELYLVAEELLSILATMILDPELKVEKAIKKNRALFRSSYISADKEDSFGRTLLEKISGKPSSHEIYEEDEEDERYQFTREHYLQAVSERNRNFLEDLFEREGCLLLDVLKGVEPSDMNQLIEEWLRGKIEIRLVDEEVERDLQIFIRDYMIKGRYEWLAEEIGDNNADMMAGKVPHLLPIETMEKSLAVLRRIGISDERIAARGHRLLGTSREILEENYQTLSSLGISDRRIAANVQLLTKRSETIRENYQTLISLRLSNKKIAAHASLLGINPYTIRRNFQRLRLLGLSDNKILTTSDLLSRDPDCVERNYERLKSLGLSDRKISTNITLLSRDTEVIKQNYQHLQSVGLSAKKIATQAQLLGISCNTIKTNYQLLRNLGLSDSKIVSQAQLLGLNPRTVERKYQKLKSLGISDSKIASQAQLLARDPTVMMRNYVNLIRLLRDNYQDRESGRKLICSHAQLLGMSAMTMEAIVQDLYDKGINCNYGILLNTTPQTKRRKMAWMLREVFDYRKAKPADKPEIIREMYAFVRNKSCYLSWSISRLEKNKEKLRNAVIRSKNEVQN